jgi:hypothetical protein
VHPHAFSDAAKKRDPTQSNDIRRRMATGMRQSLALWRSQAYAALVEADQFGYSYGDVDPGDIEALLERLDTLLLRQAEFAFTPATDNMETLLRTAYARGVRKAGQEVAPVLPLTNSTTDLILKARTELEAMLLDQIDEMKQQLEEDDTLAAAATRSRHLLYTMAVLPFVIRPLVSRLNALSSTNVTRAYNAGKLDAYEELGIQTVGVEAETHPDHRVPESMLPEENPEAVSFPEERDRPPEAYTVETVGDDKVCDICENYEGNSYTLAEARDLIPAHPNCRCSIVPLT